MALPAKFLFNVWWCPWQVRYLHMTEGVWSSPTLFAENLETCGKVHRNDTQNKGTGL